MANKIRIVTNAAAPAMGTYSQAIRTGDLVFVTAQTTLGTGPFGDGIDTDAFTALESGGSVMKVLIDWQEHTR